ncbi:glyoxalase [Micromonospora craterilacus]|uniref:Glyoxalase n=1 Tax=Micromonospora craterilacus TaxID=1655439 RepID=A0A2W2F6Z5_9ACTN|nr:VOC family protein [Micromonospora craterilacus]PZG17327.1 glyoxalase [Micromonospora craterilacus]
MTPHLDMIGLVTTDMARTLDFYRRLGIDIPAGAESAPHVEVTLPGGLRLAWDDVTTIRSFDPDWTPPAGSPRAALAFRCADPAEVDRWYAELTDAGAHGHLAPWDAPWSQRYAVLHAPDGNAVDLFAPLPTPAEPS